MVEIVKFFKTGKPPVTAEETLEILAFMEAADESKRQGGAPVSLESVMKKAEEQIAKGAAERHVDKPASISLPAVGAVAACLAD